MRTELAAVALEDHLRTNPAGKLLLGLPTESLGEIACSNFSLQFE
jgi:hypothetical protein